MKQIGLFNQALTMSSLEISELVESRHDSVKRAIERLANQGVIEFPPTVEIKTSTKPYLIYQIMCRKTPSFRAEI